MVKLFDSGLCPIGVDLGSHAIRLVQFRRTRGAEASLALQAACRIELESFESGATGPARYAAAVKHAMANQEFSGKNIIVSLPAECAHTKSVRLPQMPDSDLSQALQWEAKDRFGFECGAGSGGQLVWFRAGEVRRGTEVKDEILLFAVEGGVLNSYIQALADLGLRIRAVDLAPCAIHRGAQRTASGAAMLAGGAGAMLDIGHRGTQFFITRADELVFYKYIDIGGHKINETIAGKLGIATSEVTQMRARLVSDPASSEETAPLAKALRDAMRAPLEELAKELDMCMRYFVVTFRGSRPETILLSGRQAGCGQVRDTLAAALGLRVEESQPMRGVQDLGDAARPDRSGEWAVAAGLSLYSDAVKAQAEAA
jgi:type IV pilus assembly protein PilM